MSTKQISYQLFCFLFLPWILGATNNTTNTHGIITSQDPGCVNGTSSDVDGYYVTIGTCQNHPVYMQRNATIYSSDIDSVYVLYYGNFSDMSTYGFYWCENKEAYSVNGETDNNDENSADCASPGSMTGCSDVPSIYCGHYNNYDEYYSDNHETSDDLPTFFDYCRQFKWRLHDGSNSNDEYIKTLIFYPNSHCNMDNDNNDGIPDSTPYGSGSTGGTSDNPNALSEELTDAWVVLGVIIGVIIIVIGFIAMLKRGKYIWEIRRANRPVILPMSSKDGIRELQLDDDDEDDIDEELGAVIVSGTHKTIHEGRRGGGGSMNHHHRIGNHGTYDNHTHHHVPEAPAPPIPMRNHSNNLNNEVSQTSATRIKNEMLHESMIAGNDNNDNNINNNNDSQRENLTNNNNNNNNNRNNNNNNSSSKAGNSGTYHAKQKKTRLRANDDDDDDNDSDVD